MKKATLDKRYVLGKLSEIEIKLEVAATAEDVKIGIYWRCFGGRLQKKKKEEEKSVLK